MRGAPGAAGGLSLLARDPASSVSVGPAIQDAPRSEWTPRDAAGRGKALPRAARAAAAAVMASAQATYKKKNLALYVLR